ncbi:MAG: hypothetical protein IJY93_06080 [Clostridia bacterium]|nr:hypothetical protein [Clostridia bacterium]
MNNNIPIGRAPSVLDRRTALLAASALFIFGTFLGCAIYRLLGIGESELYDNLIERYFLALFYKCTSPADVIRVAADCILHEVWLFAVVFFAGFTIFTTVVSAVSLLYRGLLFGFAMTMLQFSTRIGLLLDSIVYLCAAFAMSMLLALLSVEALQFYYPERRPILKSRRTLSYAAVFLRICTLVCVNVLFMLFLIYVYI